MRITILLYNFLLGIALLFSATLKAKAPQPVARPLYRLAQRPNYYELARQAFIDENYTTAVKFAKKHLAYAPYDDRASNLLGSSYFHLGMAAAAINYLKKVERRTSTPAYNKYYQGISYLLLKKYREGVYELKLAARFLDDFGSRAIFELAMVAYHRREDEQAAYWFRQYLLKFPRGIYVGTAQKALLSIDKNEYLAYLRGVKYPDTKVTLYKYSPWSLFDFEHFWLFDFGSGYQERREKEPIEGGGIRNANYVDYYLLLNAGIGIGPIKKNRNSLTAGYIYNQKWNTTSERLEKYLSDPTDMEYFVYRPDLLYRKHDFFGEYQREIWDDFIFGLYGQYSFERMGSSLITSPEDTQLQKSLDVATSNLLIPWLGAIITENIELGFYSYLYKEINSEAKEFSFKTYDFGSKSPVLSLGLRSNFTVPDYNTKLYLNLYRYEYVFNDLWLDYKREGLSSKVSHELFSNIYLSLNLAYYTDTYLIPHLQVGSCKTVNAIKDDGGTPRNCERTDTGFAYDLQLYWDYTNFSRISFSYSHLENRNPAQTQFDSNSEQFLFQISLAFPSVDDIINNVRKFDEYRFYKKEMIQ